MPEGTSYSCHLCLGQITCMLRARVLDRGTAGMLNYFPKTLNGPKAQLVRREPHLTG